jgi:adenylate kinase
LIAEKFSLPHIATGDLLREAVAKQTYLGKTANEYMSTGRLVPDQVVIRLILERIKNSDAKRGYILDGFPRTIQQAEGLAESEDMDIVLNIDVEFNLLLERLTGRRSCNNCGSVFHIKYNPPKTESICDKCGSNLYQRSDDRKEVIENRLKTYNEQTKPLIDFYNEKGKLKDVPGSGSIEDIFEHIANLLKEFGLKTTNGS